MSRICVIAATCVLIPVSAMAQWRVTAYVGRSSTSPTDVTVTSPSQETVVTLSDVRLLDESFTSPVYYGWRIGRAFARAPWLGVEAEFIHAKVISRPADTVDVRGRLRGDDVSGPRPLGTVLPRFELSHGLNFLLLNAIVRVPLSHQGPSARVTLVARAGVGPTLPHVEATFDADRAYAYQWGRAAWQAAGGAEIRLRGPLSVVVETKWTATGQDVAAGNTRITAVMRSTHLATGLVWRF